MTKSTGKTFIFGCVWLGLGIVPLPAQGSSALPVTAIATAKPRLLRLQMEFVDVPHSRLTQLMAESRSGLDDTSLRKSVAALVESGEASVMETLICSARSGEKAAIGSIREFIYPTEYEGGSVVYCPPLPKEEDPAELRKLELRPPMPTAFETRNLGTSAEIEAGVTEDGKTVEVQLQSEIAYHIGDETWAEWRDQFGDASMKMPAVYALNFKAPVVLEAGKPQMIAALSPKGADGNPDRGRKLMVFVRCEVLEPGR